jgi:accessory gene regulator protein AgrB
MQKMKEKLSALHRFWRKHRISFVLFLLLAVGVVFAGLHDTGIVLGILAAMILIIEMSRRWRRIRNFLILFAASFLGIIFLAFLDEAVVKPMVRFLGGAAAVNGTGFEVFNQIISLIILFFGVAGLITGLLGAFVLVIVRLVMLRNRPKTEART